MKMAKVTDQPYYGISAPFNLHIVGNKIDNSPTREVLIIWSKASCVFFVKSGNLSIYASIRKKCRQMMTPYTLRQAIQSI